MNAPDEGRGIVCMVVFCFGAGGSGPYCAWGFFLNKGCSSACHYVTSGTRETSKEIMGKQAPLDPQFPEPLKLFLDDGLLRVWFFVLSFLGRRSSGNSYTFSIFMYDSSGLLNILILR